MTAVTHRTPERVPARIELPHEFVEEFFAIDATAEASGGARERRPGLGILVCVGFVGLFWGSAALLVL